MTGGVLGSIPNHAIAKLANKNSKRKDDGNGQAKSWGFSCWVI